MSAIQSLLRVMTLRDAEAMILEAGKVPSLRRRGQIEALAMPAIDARMIEDFVAPLMGEREVSEVPTSVTFKDTDGTSYNLTVERGSAGVRVVVRKGAKAKIDQQATGNRQPATGNATARVPEVAKAAVVAEVDDGVVEEEADDDDSAAREAAHRGANSVRRGRGRGTTVARLAQLLAPLIAAARDHGASDVIVSTRQTPRMRLDGSVELLEMSVDDAELAACVGALGGEAGADLSLEIDGSRVRVNAFQHLGGCAVAARLIRDRVPGLSDLGLPGELGSVVDHRDGLVVVCGPTGSGKSTTLAALIDLLDQRRAAHVITLEDPIEYRFQPRRCLIHQREIGTHAPTFASGLRAALREAPDVILLGELRDRDTIAAALTAAETGHLVLATLHAPSAAGAVDRMIDVFPENAQRQIRWQIASVLRTVVTQYLLPRKDGGRAVAAEIVPVIPAVANIIRKGDLHTLGTAIQSGREHGMVPLERSLAKLIDSGAVAASAVRKIAADADLLAALQGKLR